MGLDILDKQRKISRHKARQAARLIVALDAVERLGTSMECSTKPASRRQAYTDAGLASMVQQNFLRKIR